MTDKEKQELKELREYQANIRNKWRANFKNWLDRDENREAWNKKMRERYAAKKAAKK